MTSPAHQPVIGTLHVTHIDDQAEVFTLANAQTLVSFAQANFLGRLAFWSVDRDQPCSGTVSGLPSCTGISQSPLGFTKIFVQFTG